MEPSADVLEDLIRTTQGQVQDRCRLHLEGTSATDFRVKFFMFARAARV